MTATRADERRAEGLDATPVSATAAARLVPLGSTNKSHMAALRGLDQVDVSIREAGFSPPPSGASGTPVSMDFWRSSMAGIAAFGALLAVPATASLAAAEAGTALVQHRRVNEPRMETGTNASSPPVREMALVKRSKRGLGRGAEEQAVDDLKVWLLLNDSDVAELCGVSRRSLTNWRQGTSAYGASSRRLYSLHALVGHLGKVLGPDRAFLWLHADDGTETGTSRVERLGSEDGIRRILTQAEPILFPKTAPYGSFDVNAGLSEAEISEVLASARGMGAVPGGAPRRPRKVT